MTSNAPVLISDQQSDKISRISGKNNHKRGDDDGSALALQAGPYSIPIYQQYYVSAYVP
jgi:hypothetical protein